VIQLSHSGEISEYENKVVESRRIFFSTGSFSKHSWIEVYQTLDVDDLPRQLPLALSLIHPEFWDGHDFEITRGFQPLAFKNSLRWREKDVPLCCWWKLLGESRECATEQPVEADHIWPKSLGGLRANGNCQPVCRLHNKMKGNSIFSFDWSRWPSWLRALLRNMHAWYS